MCVYIYIYIYIYIYVGCAHLEQIPAELSDADNSMMPL